MKNIFGILIVIHFSSNLTGQNIVYQENLDSFLHASAVSCKIDTLEYWNYKLDLTYKPNYMDSVMPIGLLTFYRTKSVGSSLKADNDGRLSKPTISFEIYNLSEASFCEKKADYIRVISSCSSPNAGGDCFKFGNFTFLNRQVCLNCYQSSTNIDYCRATINYVFKKIPNPKVTDIKELVKQFAVKEGQ